MVVISEELEAFNASVKSLIREKERVRILSALDSVDYVTVFSSGELEKLIEAIRPDVLTKGSNYSSEEVLWGKSVERLGGRVALVPVIGNLSSSGIISAIRNEQ